MKKKSAGLLPYRFRNGSLEIFLAHPGGPYWIKRDIGAWSIVKGEFFDNETPLQAALREFKEETSLEAQGVFVELRPVRQSSGKVVHCFAVEMDIDVQHIQSNNFTIEWPPKSGYFKDFPEIDRTQWFHISEARSKMIPAQIPFIEELKRLLDNSKLKEQ